MEKDDAIMQIFHGIRGQQESVSLSEKYKALFNQSCESEKALREKLSPELLPLLDEALDDIHNAYCEAVDNYYAEGFRFGCLLGFDVMKNFKN